MAVNFSADPTQVNTNCKVVQTKVVKLTYANFGVTPVDALVARIPANATIVGIRYYNQTKLAGNSISAATLSIGTTSGSTNIVNAFDVFTTVGTMAYLSPIATIMHNLGAYLGSWTSLDFYARGTATTGDPTSGTIYLMIDYVQ